MTFLPWINRTPATPTDIAPVTPSRLSSHSPGLRSLLKRLWGGALIVIGYLLSPLCWWNDLVFNLPLALGFGYVCSRPYPEAFMPLTVVGYWLSNVIGFMLMHQGTMTALHGDAHTQDPQRSLRNGLLTSTLYTLAIVVLLQLHLVDTPDFFQGDILHNLEAMLPDSLPLSHLLSAKVASSL